MIALFEQLSQIPRASGEREKPLAFLQDFCTTHKAAFVVDRTGNLLATIGEPKFCLQAHYDMVCLGEQPPVLIREGEWLRAACGTLGADNGIGVALMLSLIAQRVAGEYLFTSDEEIGLIGAKNLELYPQSEFLINLDSEREGSLTIGCAGGEDWLIEIPVQHEKVLDGHSLYRIRAQGFLGGHSGVDIHQDRPSALVTLLGYLYRLPGCQIVSLEGGERTNAIAREAQAVVALPRDSSSPISSSAFVVEPIDSGADAQVVVSSRRLLSALLQLPHGVLGWEAAYGVPAQSANFALLEMRDSKLVVTLSLRGNRTDLLRQMGDRIRALCELMGWQASGHDRYPPWPPTHSHLVDRVAAAMVRCGIEPRIEVIHAGLECGVLSERLAHMQMVSVGPTICEPHSDRERVHLPSVERFQNLIKEVCRDLSA